MIFLTIRLENLQFHANHGLFPQEQTIGGVFTVSLSVKVSADPVALKSDNIANTISYADIFQVVRNEMSQHSDLLENLAYRISISLKHKFPEIISGSVSVTKLNPPIPQCTGSATITLEF